MRICQPDIALDNVWHILEVLEGSPAESAGLVPYGDWIVGWAGGVLHGENDFLEVVEAVSWFSVVGVETNSSPVADSMLKNPCGYTFTPMTLSLYPSLSI